jgi:hypothetical protein
MAEISNNITTGSKALPPTPNNIEAPPAQVTAEIAHTSPVAKDLAQLAQNSGQRRGSEQETDSTNSHDDQVVMAAWTNNTTAKVAEFV